MELTAKAKALQTPANLAWLKDVTEAKQIKVGDLVTYTFGDTTRHTRVLKIRTKDVRGKEVKDIKCDDLLGWTPITVFTKVN